MEKIFGLFLFTYVFFSPIYAIFITVFLVKKILKTGMSGFSTWIVVLIINILLFFPVTYGAEGFATFMPWFWLFYNPSGVIFSKDIAAIAIVVIVIITTTVVLLMRENRKDL